MSVMISSQASGVSFPSPSSASVAACPDPSAILPSLQSVDWNQHKQLLCDYLLYHARVFTDPQSTQVLSLFAANSHNAQHPTTRAAALSKYYYDRLAREFAVTDLSLYKLGKIGLRWRTPTELLHGKGQFICASKDCQQSIGLVSMELEFCYQEPSGLKRSLVQVRVCPTCASHIHYRKKRTNAMNGAFKRKFSSVAEESNTRRRVEEESKDRAASPTGPEALFPDASYHSPPKRALSPHSASTSPSSPSDDFAVPPPRLPRIRTPEQQANLERKRSLERERSLSPLSSDSLSPEPTLLSLPTHSSCADRSPADLVPLIHN